MNAPRSVAARRQIPATTQGVERTVVLAFVGIRTFDLVQTAIAMSTGALAASTAPALDLTFIALVVVESALLGRWLLKRGSVLPLRWPLIVDFGLAFGLILASPSYLPPESRLAVWTMWVYPVTLSTVTLIGGVLGRLEHVVAASGVLAVAYLAVVALPLGGDQSGRAAGLANSLAYPGFALVAFIFCRFVRRLAEAADVARQRVAELERDRGKALVHDLLVYLQLDRFAVADEQTQVAMIMRARQKHQQMRSYVDGADVTQSVVEHVLGILTLHPALAIRHVVDIDHSTQLPSEIVEHLGRAVDTALANVGQHAPGAEVEVTLRSDRDHLVVSVRDNGPGFDPAASRPGYGIAEILGRQLELVGGRSAVHSVPGHGTDVSITVPRQP